MRCPFCGSLDTQVKDSRPSEDSAAIRRRRVCTACGQRFTTFERVQLRELMVVKRNGMRMPFDRDKLVGSLEVALRKRPVDPERIERMVSGLVRRLESLGESEIPSATIGELVMEGLKQLDDVAYVRFASVYRNFREAKDFESVLDELQGEGERSGTRSWRRRYRSAGGISARPGRTRRWARSWGAWKAASPWSSRAASPPRADGRTRRRRRSWLRARARGVRHST